MSRIHWLNIYNRDVLFEYHWAVVPFVEQLDQLEVCLPYSRLLPGIQKLLVFQNLTWNSNKTSLLRIKCDKLIVWICVSTTKTPWSEQKGVDWFAYEK